MIKGKSNLVKEILFHTILWSFILFYDVVAWGYIEHDYAKSFYVHLLILPAKILVGCVVAYWIVPRFLYTKRYAIFVLSVIIGLIMGGALMNTIHVLYIFPKYSPEILKIDPLFSLTFMFTPVWNLLPSTGILSAYVIVQRSFRFQQTAQTLEKEKLAAELNFLRSQVHPHFLFNTLNNLYALTLKNAKEASTVVLKLSELLNYMLYESSTPFVPLDKELQSIRNYLALEQLRYGDNIEVIFNVKGPVEKVHITPLLLIHLVENCFKHGPEKGIKGGWVEIDIAIKEQLFIIKVENSKSGASSRTIDENREGIGFKNLRRRLELIYKEKYEIKIMDESDRFLVVLKLDLDTANNPVL